MHEWYYMKSGMIEDHRVGPLEEAAFLVEIQAGRVKPKMLISSATRTKAKWCPMEKIPGCMKVWHQGEAERLQEAERQAAAKREEAERRAAERQLIVQQQRAAHQEKVSLISAISDGQSADAVLSIRDQVQSILTRQEEIEYIAVQARPILNVKPDAVVATNRRLIFFHPKLLGRFSFRDFVWRELHNAHVQQGIIGSTFQAYHTSGTLLKMEYLSKESAARLYCLAQEREEEAVQTRRNLALEEKQAGAAKIAIQNNVGNGGTTTQPETVAAKPDLVQRLSTLKSMLDQGLISAEDYESRKQEILRQV